MQEWDEHDNNFKTLNSQLLKEVADYEARAAAGGHLLGAAGVRSTHNWLGDEDETGGAEDWGYEGQGGSEVMAATAKLSGKTLRELAGAGEGGLGSGGGGVMEGVVAAAPAARAAGTAALLRLYRQQQEQQQQQGATTGLAAAAEAASAGACKGPVPSTGIAFPAPAADEEYVSSMQGVAVDAPIAGGPLESALGAAAREDGWEDGFKPGSSSSSSSGREGGEAMEAVVEAAMQHEDRDTDAAEGAMARLGSLDEDDEEMRGQHGAQEGQGQEQVGLGKQHSMGGQRQQGFAEEGRDFGGEYVANGNMEGVVEEQQQGEQMEGTGSDDVEGQQQEAASSTRAGLPILSDEAPGEHGPAGPGVPSAADVEAMVEDVGSAGDPALEKLQRVQQALQELKHTCTAGGGGNAAYNASLQALRGLVSNLVQHPGVAKYKRLRLGNALVSDKIGRYPSAVQVLQIAGFERRQEEWQTGLGAAKEDVMVYVRNDPGLLWLVLSALSD